VKTTHKRIWSG